MVINTIMSCARSVPEMLTVTLETGACLSSDHSGKQFLRTIGTALPTTVTALKLSPEGVRLNPATAIYNVRPYGSCRKEF
jgi:hypothetical protein